MLAEAGERATGDAALAEAAEVASAVDHPVVADVAFTVPAVGASVGASDSTDAESEAVGGGGGGASDEAVEVRVVVAAALDFRLGPQTLVALVLAWVTCGFFVTVAAYKYHLEKGYARGLVRCEGASVVPMGSASRAAAPAAPAPHRPRVSFKEEPQVHRPPVDSNSTSSEGEARTALGDGGHDGQESSSGGGQDRQESPTSASEESEAPSDAEYEDGHEQTRQHPRHTGGIFEQAALLEPQQTRAADI